MLQPDKNKTYTIYVLYSKAFKKIYIGYTADLEDRFNSHNKMATKGYTIKYRPWEILLTEEFENKIDAIKREKQLKSGGGRRYIWEVVSNKYPTAN